MELKCSNHILDCFVLYVKYNVVLPLATYCMLHNYYKFMHIVILILFINYLAKRLSLVLNMLIKHQH